MKKQRDTDKGAPRRQLTASEDDDDAAAPEQQNYDASYKILVSRIPGVFREASVQRLLEDALGPHSVIHVALAYDRQHAEDETDEGPAAGDKNASHNKKQHLQEGDRFYRPHQDKTKQKQRHNNDEYDEEEDMPTTAQEKQVVEQELPHRGFGFATLQSVDLVQKAIHEVQTVRGGANVASTRKHTLYLGPCLNDPEEENDPAQAQLALAQQPCFLFAKQGRCPYGDKCKFTHTASSTTSNTDDNDGLSAAAGKKKKKCRDHRKNKCKLGETCPFSHDFAPAATTVAATAPGERRDSEKDCINWKTKGKCRKLEQQQQQQGTNNNTCPYRHDPAVQQLALEKKKKKMQANSVALVSSDTPDGGSSKRQRPASTMVRVFGLNYETKEQDVRQLFAACGTIVAVDFPTEQRNNSNNNKGYCGVTFESSEAVDQAMRLSGTQLHGRWLEVQPGRMLLEQWEKKTRRNDTATSLKRQKTLPTPLE